MRIDNTRHYTLVRAPPAAYRARAFCVWVVSRFLRLVVAVHVHVHVSPPHFCLSFRLLSFPACFFHACGCRFHQLPPVHRSSFVSHKPHAPFVIFFLHLFLSFFLSFFLSLSLSLSSASAVPPFAPFGRSLLGSRNSRFSINQTIHGWMDACMDARVDGRMDG